MKTQTFCWTASSSGSGYSFSRSLHCESWGGGSVWFLNFKSEFVIIVVFSPASFKKMAFLSSQQICCYLILAQWCRTIGILQSLVYQEKTDTGRIKWGIISTSFSVIHLQNSWFACQNISENKFALLGQHSSHLLSFSVLQRAVKSLEHISGRCFKCNLFAIVFLADGCLECIYW